jgi:uncharacterized OB-fold protein
VRQLWAEIRIFWHSLITGHEPLLIESVRKGEYVLIVCNHCGRVYYNPRDMKEK